MTTTNQNEYTNYDEFISSINETNPELATINMVIRGFSGLGYQDPEGVKQAVKEKIDFEARLMATTPDNKSKLNVVCGATSDGIGKIVYDSVKELKEQYEQEFKNQPNKPILTSCGIVSESAKKYGIDANCEKTLFVSDPNNTWEVKNTNGDSYMVDIAKEGGPEGFLVYFGGGEVAIKEVEEAKMKGIPVEVYIDSRFNPDPYQVDKKRAEESAKTGRAIDPTPLKRYVESFTKVFGNTVQEYDQYTKSAFRHMLLRDLENVTEYPGINALISIGTKGEITKEKIMAGNTPWVVVQANVSESACTLTTYDNLHDMHRALIKAHIKPSQNSGEVIDLKTLSKLVIDGKNDTTKLDVVHTVLQSSLLAGLSEKIVEIGDAFLDKYVNKNKGRKP